MNKVLEVCNGPMNWFKFFVRIKFPISDLKTLAKLEERVEVTFILGSTLACCLFKSVKANSKISQRFNLSLLRELNHYLTGKPLEMASEMPC